MHILYFCRESSGVSMFLFLLVQELLFDGSEDHFLTCGVRNSKPLRRKKTQNSYTYYHHLANKHSSSSNWTTDADMKKIDHENTFPY